MDLKIRVELMAARLNKGKNWVITRALEEYVERHSRDWLKEEARRQSLLAGERRWKDEELWERASSEVWPD